MPWYWTDEIASVLVGKGRIGPDVAAVLIAVPLALRSEHDTVEDAAAALLDDGEIPLAA